MSTELSRSLAAQNTLIDISKYEDELENQLMGLMAKKLLQTILPSKNY